MTLALSVVALLVACSPNTKPAGGLELILDTDMNPPADFDKVLLEITQEVPNAGPWHRDYRIPQEATLPTTFAIRAGSNPNQYALIRVTAIKSAPSGDTPLVLREAEVQVPTDRVAELRLVLGAKCLGKLTPDANGVAQPACPKGQSCQPDTGACASSVVDSSALPTYSPADIDAGANGVDGGEADAPRNEAGDGGCPASGLTCSGACVPNDVHNCGACGHDCTNLSHVSGPVTCLTSGACSFPSSSCAPGWMHCGGTGTGDLGCETDISTTSNCGSCGKPCSGATPVCSATADAGVPYACAGVCPTSMPTQCSGSCVDTRSSATHCSTCANVCMTTVPHAQPACAGSACTVTCNTGYSLCAGACVDEQTDPSHCGACATMCTGAAPVCLNRACACPSGYAVSNGVCCPNGQTGCSGACVNVQTDSNNCGACGVTCAGGQSCLGGVCPNPTITAPQLIAPLSTATVTSRRPTLRWILAAGTTGAAIDLCRDRACATPITTLMPVGTTTAPTVDLPTGVVYWRAHGRSGTTTGTAVTPTWQFTVGFRTAPVDASSGTTLDVNGDGFADVAIGAPSYNSSAGRAYVYLGGASGLSTTAAWNPPGSDGAGGNFGASVASAGDVNGDGYCDVIVGAYGASGGAGRAYVYLGGPSGLATTPAWSQAAPDGAGSAFGAAVSSAGDVNGDGYADVAVGAGGWNGSTGRVYVFLGGASGLATTPAWNVQGPDGAGGNFGNVASAGDVNGDGFADLAVGSYATSTNLGRVRVYLGSAMGLSTTAAFNQSAPDSSVQRFGSAIASAGDVNGDGYSDLLVGGGVYSAAMRRSYVYLGGPSGLATTPAWNQTAPGGANIVFGLSVSSAGDVNLDGYADILIGAGDWYVGQGRAFIFLGSSTGPATTPVWTGGPEGAGGSYGFAVAGVGDVDGDGYADVAVGTNGAEHVYVYMNSSSGLATTTWNQPPPDGAGSGFGASIARAN